MRRREHEEIAFVWERYNPRPAVIVERITESRPIPRRRFLVGLIVSGLAQLAWLIL